MVEGIEQFNDIRPYEPEEMKQAFNDLLNDRQFNLIMKGFAPWLPKFLRNGLLRLAFMGVKSPLDFQMRFMKPVVRYIISKYTDGCAFQHDQLLADKQTPRYTFVSNHRDIVLDSAFLDLKLIEAGYPTTVEIGIGDNLLIYPWIKRLVRMNKAFTVRRGLTPKEMFASSQLMSRYIHFAVTKKRENIWIAQREGRAKDSDDRTQESVLKMMAMGGDLKELNIVPLTISYEFDPCDYLKAQEFQQKRDNPAFKKSKQDDLDNMKTGILGYKGRVTYHCGKPINAWIDDIVGLPKNEFFAQLAQRMDREIHRGYTLYPCNYIALDMLIENGEFLDEPSGRAERRIENYDKTQTSNYTAADRQRFEKYLTEQLAKIKLPNKDEAFLRQKMLEMYSNPVKNQLAAQ